MFAALLFQGGGGADGRVVGEHGSQYGSISFLLTTTLLL
jgi:hypothetical protein